MTIGKLVDIMPHRGMISKSAVLTVLTFPDIGTSGGQEQFEVDEKIIEDYVAVGIFVGISSRWLAEHTSAKFRDRFLAQLWCESLTYST